MWQRSFSQGPHQNYGSKLTQNLVKIFFIFLDFWFKKHAKYDPNGVQIAFFLKVTKIAQKETMSSSGSCPPSDPCYVTCLVASVC